MKSKVKKFIFCFTAMVLVLSFLYILRDRQEKENYYQKEISTLQSEIFLTEQQNFSLHIENNQLSTDNNQLLKENETIKIESAEIIENSQKLSTFLEHLNNQQNELVETASLAAQFGSSRPSEVGYTPIFRFSLDKVDKDIQEETLFKLSQGSYQYEQEIVWFNLEDISSWQDIGFWDFTGYTATVVECDSTPSYTANDSLVTPGFTIAVDPDYWDYGTIFYIDGVGFAIAADCGGAIQGEKRGDILVSSLNYSNYISGSQRQVWLVYEPS